MKIIVTKKDIEQGIHKDPESCPIALAVKRRFKAKHGVEPKYISVGGWNEITLEVNDKKYELPNEAVDFYIKFDHNEVVLPFKFELGRELEESDE